MLPKINIVV